MTSKPSLNRLTRRRTSTEDARCAGSTTLYGAPDCRRRYAEGPGDATLADAAGYHLDGRGLLPLGQPAGSPQFLAVRLRLLQARPGTAAYGHQFLVGHPGGEAGQSIAQERLRRIGVGIQVLGPGVFVIGQAANPHPAPLQVVDIPHGVQPAPPDAVDGHHNQGVALGQPGFQRVPAPPAVGTGGSGDADVLIDVRKRHAGGQQLLALGLL